MAKLTITDASRVAGVTRSTFYRAIQTDRLSADSDGYVDTATLLRAGYTLQRSAQQIKGVSQNDATPTRNSPHRQGGYTGILCPTTGARHVTSEARSVALAA
jgi:hypothetical protein